MFSKLKVRMHRADIHLLMIESRPGCSTREMVNDKLTQNWF
jgi:hypothetical protein